MMLAIDSSSFAHGDVTRDIIGAFYDIYNALGFGFVESVYANAMPIALTKRGVSFERERPMCVHYDNIVVGQFRADLVAAKTVIVELKAADQIAAAHERQLLNYLRASQLRVGLILNFGPKPAVRRITWTGDTGELTDLGVDTNG